MKSSTKSLGLLVVVLGAVVAFASWLLRNGESRLDPNAPHDGAIARTAAADGTNEPAVAPATSGPQRSELKTAATPAPAVADPSVPTADHVSGVVVDATGRPIANAAVTFGPGGTPFQNRRPPQRGRGFAFAFNNNGPAQPDPVATRTAADGTFQLAKVPRVEGLELRVDHPDYVMLVRNDLIVPTSGLDVGRITLEAGGAVTGQVFGPDGAKLAGAEVSLRDSGDATPNPRRFFDFRFGPRGERKATTDAEGRFKLTGMPKGRALVAATHEAMLEATSPPIEVVPMQEVGGVTLTLERGHTVTGVVHDSAGKPVAGATVRADTGDGFARWQRFANGAETDNKSGPDGHFEIRGLKPGVYEVSAEAVGFAPKSVAGVDSASGTPVDVVLGASAHVAGKVRVKGTNEPARNVKVQLVPNWGDQSFVPTLDFADSENKATADGEFLIADVDPNHYRVVARGDGTARAASDPIEVGEGQSVDGVEIEVERGAVVTGRVLDPSGGPVANAEVVCSVQRAQSSNAQPQGARQFRISSRAVRAFGGRGRFDPSRQTVARGKSDAEGRYQLDQLPAGTYTIDVTQADFADARVDAVEVAAAATKENVDVHLTRGGSVEGSITGIDGKPRAGDRVDVESKTVDGVTKSAVSDANGSFRVEHVPAGEAVATRFESDGGNGGGGFMSIVVAGNGGNEPDPGKHVVVVEGETVHVDFSQVEKPYVEGIVTCVDGPVAGATVSAMPDFSQGRPFLFGAQKQAITGPDGSFRLTDLDPGTWNLNVRHPQGLVATSAQVKLEAGARARHDFALEGGVVEGDVLSQVDKSKLDGATVTLQRVDGSAAGGMTFTTDLRVAIGAGGGGGRAPRAFRFGGGGDGGGRVTTDRTGHFRAPWVPAGKYRVSARRNGFLEAQSDEFEIATNGHVEHADVALAPAAMLHVTVRSKATGLVQANCAVQVESETGESDWRTTDTDGVARFDSLKPGTWSVTARHSFDSEEGTKSSTACEAGHTAEITVDL
jgi:uncharacterized GH25 family protein